MDPKQFDNVTRLFALRRISRRTVMLAGASAAIAGVAGTAAQATPEASSDDKTAFMFVQTFGPGSLAPSATNGLLTLTADHLAAQTLFFSDRPERIVGMVPTEQFLSAGPNDVSGFSELDPPNAALVFSTADGNGDIAVLELIDPTFDASNGTVTYSVRLLDDVESVGLSLETTPVSAESAPRDFAAASLFIDDCPDGQVVCLAGDGSGEIGQFPSPSGSMGFCYDAAQICCKPCQAPPFDNDWASSCNQTFASCLGNCGFSFNGGWACN
jgi:hypothetical protein